MDSLKVGIIGCGGIAFGKHMPNLQKTGKVEMVGFFDIDEERAAKAKAEFGTDAAKTYTDYRALLENPPPNIQRWVRRELFVLESIKHRYFI